MNSIALLEENQRDFYSDRNYSPAQGRFLSEDPIGFRGGDRNLYRYIANRATFGTDPFGELFFVPIIVNPVVIKAIVYAGAGTLAALTGVLVAESLDDLKKLPKEEKKRRLRQNSRNDAINLVEKYCKGLTGSARRDCVKKIRKIVDRNKDIIDDKFKDKPKACEAKTII